MEDLHTLKNVSSKLPPKEVNYLVNYYVTHYVHAARRCDACMLAVRVGHRMGGRGSRGYARGGCMLSVGSIWYHLGGRSECTRRSAVFVC